MASGRPLTRTELINLWVQIVGIIAAGVWAAYSFVYKEIRQPASAPVNVTLELALSDRGVTAAAPAPQSENLLAIELQVSARNPSTREVKLFPGMFVITGETLKKTPPDLNAYLEKISQATYSHTATQRHAAFDPEVVLAFGVPFRDEVLRPNETIRRHIVIFVPAGRYHLLTAGLSIPTAGRTEDFSMEWKLNPKTNAITADLYEMIDGKPVPVPTDTAGGYIVPLRLDLQQSNAVSQLALTNPPARP